MTHRSTAGAPPVEWPTVGLFMCCYLTWAVATAAAARAPWLAWPAAALTMALHSSLTHEAVHGHPTRRPRLNAALAFPALGLFIPYGRFRDLHLAHHRDETLTDPYDDPESNFMDPAVWARLPRWARAALRANNTLLGRLSFGPAVGLAAFWLDDLRRLRTGERAVARAWAIHAAALAPVALWQATVSTMSWVAYLAAAYAAVALIKLRAFLEHRAHESARGRTAVVEDRGLFALLFLNNNLHAVHHAHPGAPWYALPRIYAARRAEILAANGGYRYASYAEVFRRHLLRAKDPVPHPLRSA